MKKFLSAFLFLSMFSFASAICVSNSSGGTFCYDPLPPIDTTLPPLTWFVVPGGPTLPGMNIGIVERLEHDLAVLGDRNISIKEVLTSAISTYAQLMSLGNMESEIQKKCGENLSGRYAWWGLCNGFEERNTHLTKSTIVLEKAIFELKNLRPQLPIAEKLFLQVLNSVSLYKKHFIKQMENRFPRI